jgi:hypothetical protein
LEGALAPPLSPDTAGSFVLDRDSRPIEPAALVNH